MNTGVFIDDTGTPGLKSKVRYDDGNWKSWIAVILRPEQRQPVTSELNSFLERIKEKYKVSEFHFSDIYGGTNEFKSVPLKTRIQIFEFFANLVRRHKFFLTNQSYTKEDLIRHGYSFSEGLVVDGMDFNDNSDVALDTLINKTIWAIQQIPLLLPTPVDFIVDEGRQKANSKQHLSTLDTITNDSCIHYKSSKDELLLQLADFIAYTTNRMRWIGMNNKRSKADVWLLRMGIHAQFNFLGLENQSKLNLKSPTNLQYEEILKKGYQKNSNVSDDELRGRIQELEKGNKFHNYSLAERIKATENTIKK